MKVHYLAKNNVTYDQLQIIMGRKFSQDQYLKLLSYYIIALDSFEL